ncbi:MAG: hypothetical protein NC548_39890 [Lachnospiraceae bacterium]|nr:hypothetical protein [Lachnospiraceae bacterium]
MAIFATAAIGLTSCSEDIAPDSPKYDGEVNVVMTTSLPSELTTYGVTSAEGGLKNLAGKGYSVRYVMEVYPKGSDKHVVRMINYKPIKEDPESARSTSFETRLMAAEYNFVFYADIVREITLSGGIAEGLTSPCYGNRYFFSNQDETSDVLIQPSYSELPTEGSLKSIKATSNADAYYNHTSTEQYDIYTCKENVDLRYENTHSFTLKRPFAKLRIITTDSDELEEDKTPTWTQTVVTLQSSDSDNVLNNEYNAVEGTYSSNGRSYWGAFYQTTEAKNTETYEEEEPTGEKAGERTLGVFYLPISNGSYNLNFSITTHKNGTKIIEDLPISVENVPLVANKLTTIKGKLLTKNFVSEIRIDDDFEGETIVPYKKEASSPEQLLSVLSGSSETVTYTAPVKANEGLEIDFSKAVTRASYIYEEGNNATLTLIIPSIEENAVITITGGVNSPKQIVLNTSGKCSVRANLPTTTTIKLGSSVYRYLVYNCIINKEPSNNLAVDAFFFVDNGKAGDFYSTTSHSYALNEDFTINEKVCYHSDCNFNFLGYFDNDDNKTKSVWDFVGASAAMK